jgi:hypothetical protein
MTTVELVDEALATVNVPQLPKTYPPAAGEGSSVTLSPRWKLAEQLGAPLVVHAVMDGGGSAFGVLETLPPVLLAISTVNRGWSNVAVSARELSTVSVHCVLLVPC